ncbi:MAG: hypothetical protein R3279_06330 [Putridiphycobacter sp.]|nr:hypothetical protein [Putridiphycobacter sp.]
MSVGYPLGFYPTAHINMNFGIEIGTERSDLASGAKLFTNGDVYLSPRFRLNCSANFNGGTANISSKINYLLQGQGINVDGFRFDARLGLFYTVFIFALRIRVASFWLLTTKRYSG